MTETLRERLERHAGTMRGSLAAENVAATMREAAAALERVEALEFSSVLLRQGLERVATHLAKCPYAPNRGCAEAMQGEAEATLRQTVLDWHATPAPAGAQGGGDGR